MADVGRRTFSGDAVQAVRTASQAQYHLSAMADRKGSMLMGVSFIVFTLILGQAGNGDLGDIPLATIVAGVTAFLSTLFAAIALMPTVNSGPAHGGERNMMFFGGFSDMTESEYVEEMMQRLSDQPRFLEMVARDVYQNGQVLARKKYRLLRLAYSIFIAGLVASVIAFAASGLQ